MTMTAISTTRFLDPYSSSFLPKNAWGSISWALILSGSRSARSTKSPAKIFRNKLIKDWSIATTHHKSFVEAWKRGGHRSGRATVRAPNHYNSSLRRTWRKSRDNRRTIKWDVSWNIQGHNKRTWRLGGRVGSTGARGYQIMSWIRRTRWMTRRRSYVAFPPLESWREDNNEGSNSARALEIACAVVVIVRRRNRLTWLWRWSVERSNWCRTATKTRKRCSQRRQWLRPHLGT